MNHVILMGRLTRNPEIRYSNTAQGQMAIVRYTLAVDRRGKDRGADFISCVCFGKSAEFAEKYLNQGTKVVVSGRIQTGSYKNKDGNTVYTTDVVVEDQEFAESKAVKAEPAKQEEPAKTTDPDGFMYAGDGSTDELPFN